MCIRDSPFPAMIQRLMVFEGNSHTLVRFVAGVKWMPRILDALAAVGIGEEYGEVDVVPLSIVKPIQLGRVKEKSCLLYTSDAADDLLCVDLGGRRIIKKKTYKLY
eukprot:TRINITY_DN11369_c0_g1_i1.p1 TRINITY_DN11369_c0_g1~~TRINITY_DN11369_c0_g1_i1.p1  ORF type:complete len:106 (-),score=46.81 TRINITY_DN11369_c0_g1_i1:26-343(-)